MKAEGSQLIHFCLARIFLRGLVAEAEGLHVQKGLAVLPGRSEAALPEGRTLWELPSADVDDPNHCVAMKLQQPESPLDGQEDAAPGTNSKKKKK